MCLTMAVVAGVCRAGRNGFAENQSQAVDSATGDLDDWAMSEIIYPRSPRETMDGWMYLPRYIDKNPPAPRGQAARRLSGKSRQRL